MVALILNVVFLVAVVVVIGIIIYRERTTLTRVKNKNKHHLADDYYWKIKIGKEYLLFTDEEIKHGKTRAAKNTEDLNSFGEEKDYSDI